MDRWKGGRMKIFERRTQLKVVGSCADEEIKMRSSE